MKITSISQFVIALCFSASSLVEAAPGNTTPNPKCPGGSGPFCVNKCCPKDWNCGGFGIIQQCCLPTKKWARQGCEKDFDCCDRNTYCDRGTKKCYPNNECPSGKPKCTGKCCRDGWSCGGWGFAPQCCLDQGKWGCSKDTDCCTRGNVCSRGKCVKKPECRDGRDKCTGQCCKPGWNCGGFGVAKQCCLPQDKWVHDGCSKDSDCCERGNVCKRGKCVKKPQCPGGKDQCTGKCCKPGWDCGGFGFARQCCLATDKVVHDGCDKDTDCCERDRICKKGKCIKKPECPDGRNKCTGKCCKAGWQCGGFGFAPQCCVPDRKWGCKQTSDCCERNSFCGRDGKCYKKH